MRTTLVLLALCATAAVGLAACGSADEAAPTTPAAPSTTVMASPTTPPASSPAQAGFDAAALFAANCAGCHDADGSGGSGPDLRGEDDVPGIAGQIRTGDGAMPSFAGELTDAEIDALAAYVATEL